MIITSHLHGLDETISHSTGNRSPGLHISDIYTSLARALDPKRYAEEMGPNTVKMAMGLAWETHLEKVLERAQIPAPRPPEQLTLEGIAFNPDLLLTEDPSRMRVGEIKLTYMSESDSLIDSKFAKWLWQAMAYCYHLEVPRARFYVLFVRGNYKDPNPTFRAYDIEFTGRELQENWQMLLNYARHQRML